MNPSQTASYSIAQCGDFDEIAETSVQGMKGKRFLREALSLTSSEISLNRVPAGLGYGFNHKHKRNEEVYVVVAGEGTFYADDQPLPLRAGTVIRLSPGVKRTLRASESGPLDYVCFQAPEGGMPYTMREDGVPLDTKVPFTDTLPLPTALADYFAAQTGAGSR